MVLFLAIHCVWDNWAIGSCVTQTELEDGTYCGPGTRTNTRVKLVEESNGGTCDGEYEAILLRDLHYLQTSTLFHHRD